MGLLNNLLICIRKTREQREFDDQIRKNGLKIAVEQCIKDINDTITSREIAIKFVLQELDFAHKENILPKEFISNSGFHPLEYKDALDKFKENESQLLNIQTIFDNFLKKIRDKEVANISIEILGQIMYRWKIGRYSSGEERVSKPIKEEIFAEQEKVIEEIEEPKPNRYSSNRVNELMEEYSDIIGDIIMGVENPEKESRMDTFKNHISQAGIEGESDHAIVLCCFYQHKEPYNALLPIKISEMNEVSLNFFRSIVKGFSKQGFSQEFLDYTEENREHVHLLT